MRDVLIALISGLAALCLKAYNEPVSLAFSWGNLKSLLFPIAVCGTVFLTFDVVRAARHLTREVKTESELEIDLYPSLILPEKFIEKRTPSFYRAKISGMAISLIIVLVFTCVLSWKVGKTVPSDVAQPMPSSRQDHVVTATPISTAPPIASPLLTPSKSPSATATPTATTTPTATSTPTAAPSSDDTNSATAASPKPLAAVKADLPIYNDFLNYPSMVKMSPYPFWYIVGGENALRMEAKLAFRYDPPVHREQELVVYIPGAGGWLMGAACKNVVDSAGNWARRIQELEAKKNTELESLIGTNTPLRLVIFHEGPIFSRRAEILRAQGHKVFGPEEPFERP